LYKLINTCNRHVCNPTCYKNDKNAANKLCKYGFPHIIINETHFDNETELLHIKWTNQWINNENPTVMVSCRCNHDLKFIAASGKDAKALVYYIIDYIIKNTLYTSHMYSLLQVAVQKIESTFTESHSKEHLERSRQMLIRSLTPKVLWWFQVQNYLKTPLLKASYSFYFSELFSWIQP
jgi:hypothetical protein